MPTLLIRAAALLTLACPLAGQSTDWNVVKALAPGAAIRVEAAGRKVSGQFQSAGDDVLVIRSRAGEATVKRPDAVRVAVKKPGHRKRNLLIGLAIGAGAGAAIGVAASRCTGFGCIASKGIEVGAPIGLAAAGALVGAVIPTGGWREIYRRQ